MIDRLKAFFVRKKPEAPVDEKIRVLEHLIGYRIAEPELYLKALRHRSRTGDDGYSKVDTYEQLEFLGDAVLDLVVTEILFEQFPRKDEGFMTKVRAKVVRGDALAKYADALNIAEIVEIGSRAKGQRIQYSKNILADVFEAIIGAIFKDKGYEVASEFIRRIVDRYVNFEEVVRTKENFKSILLEFTQARRWTIPSYEVIKETGPDHSKTFEVQVLVNDEPKGSGKGKSKKSAEQEAARQALQALQQL